MAEHAPRGLEGAAAAPAVVLAALLSQLPLRCRGLVRKSFFGTPLGRYVMSESATTGVVECNLQLRRLTEDEGAAAPAAAAPAAPPTFRDISPPPGRHAAETPFYTPMEPPGEKTDPVRGSVEAAMYLHLVDVAVHRCDVSACFLASVVASLPPVTRIMIERQVFHNAAKLADAYNVFRPGARFLGQIKVPGINDEDYEEGAPSQYDLTVLFWGRDPLNCPIIYVCHEAYEDRQACDVNIKVVRDGGGIQVDYRDGETICSGTLDVASKEINGNVRQLEFGEEGFEYPAEEVTHTFKLSAVVEADAVVRQRAELMRAQRECARALADWNVDGFEELPRERLALGMWRQAFDAAVMEAELSLAEIRNKTRVLRKVSFASPEDRDRTITTLSSAGCTRPAAHKAIDTGLLAMRRAVLAPNKLGCAPTPRAHVEEPFPSYLHRLEFQKQLMRSSDSYHKFDEALKSAHARVPLSVISGWRLAAAGPNATEEHCAICMTSLDDGDPIVRLPCNHILHEECLVDWAHNSAVCPYCRTPLADGEGPA
mmetsp:Transcript_9365/g.24108  ORF Transcript_9365/g.24108 Transcript_9365/m.24108 type:complete len:541 (-) Transcript_9365:612-2234(-)